MTQKRKIYDAAFKRQAVELSKGRKNLSELARELGIRPHQLYNWRNGYFGSICATDFGLLVPGAFRFDLCHFEIFQ